MNIEGILHFGTLIDLFAPVQPLHFVRSDLLKPRRKNTYFQTSEIIIFGAPRCRSCENWVSE